MNIRIASVDPLKIPDGLATGVTPTWIIAIEIGYLNDDPKYLDITRIYRGQIALGDVLKDVASNASSMLNSPNKYGQNRLSVSAFDQLTYVVVRIKDDLPWEFSENLEPFSLSRKNKLFKHYGEAMKVNNDGSVVPQGEIMPGCKTGYFICDAAAIHDASPGKTFAHGFNLHLDWLVTRNNNTVQRIPFVLDPEIRDPDGTKPN